MPNLVLRANSAVGIFNDSPNQSLRFYGTGTGDIDRVKILANSSSIAANIGATDFTVDFMVKCASGNNASAITPGAGYLWITGNTIIDRDRYDQNPGWGISLTGGAITFGVKNSGGTSETWRTTTDLRDGDWHHVRLQRAVSSGAVTIWIDGVREVNDSSGPTGTLAYPNGGTPNANGEQGDEYIVFGAEKHDVDPVSFPSFRGWLGEVRFSTVLRSSSASATITPPTARFTRDGDTAGLWHFTEGSGTAILDDGGTSHGVMQVGGASNGPTRELDDPFEVVDFTLAVTTAGLAAQVQTITLTLETDGNPAVGDILNDTFEDRATGNVSMVTAWTSKGYTDRVNDSLVEITARATAPAALLSDPRVPAGKTRFLHIRHSSDEANNRIAYENFPADTRECYFSWWEYRPNDNLGGEKFFRMGNRIAGPGSNRGHDMIWTLSWETDWTLMANSENAFDYDDISFANPFDWPGLHHIEIYLRLSSTSTSSDGQSITWVDGVQVANANNIRMNEDATSAARDIELIEIGGWSSGPATFPIDRWYLGLKISTTRLGVWDIE